MRKVSEMLIYSGLIDKSLVELLEHWKTLPSGTSEDVVEEFKYKTKRQLAKFADELAVLIEKENVLRETIFTRDRCREEREVTILSPTRKPEVPTRCFADSMHRYFFRVEDVARGDLVPGFCIHDGEKEYMITEVSSLFNGDQEIAYQVITEEEHNGDL